MKTLLIIVVAPALFAQDFETHLGTETVEGFGGIIYKHGDHRAENVVGARILGGLNRYVSGYGEYAYSRVLSRDVAGPTENRLRGSYMDFGGGAELHLSGRRLQPYALGGIGALRISAKAIVGNATVTVSNYHFASSTGGGLRVFATLHVGFSVEAKTVWIPNLGAGLGSGRFERYALGMFYQQSRPVE